MKRKIRFTTITVLSVGIIIVVLQLTGLLWPLRIVFDQAFSPVGRFFTASARNISDTVGLFGSLTSLGNKNKQLEAEVLELKKQLSDMQEISKENDILRKQVGFNARLSLDLVPTRVVGYNPDNVRKYLTIDRGASSNIKKGMAAVSGGVLVGEVEEVNDYSAKIFLIDDPEFRILGLGQEGRASGVVKGQLGEGYEMEKIAQSESIRPGETVITAGSDIIPRGILIGQVEAVDRSDNALFQTAHLRPLVNTSKLEIVFVVLGQK